MRRAVKSEAICAFLFVKYQRKSHFWQYCPSVALRELSFDCTEGQWSHAIPVVIVPVMEITIAQRIAILNDKLYQIDHQLRGDDGKIDRRRSLEKRFQKILTVVTRLTVLPNHSKAWRPGQESEPIPVGMCQCGCNKPTRLATRTHADRGWVKGQPLRYRFGHQPKVRIAFGRGGARRAKQGGSNRFPGVGTGSPKHGKKAQKPISEGFQVERVVVPTHANVQI